jgi:hypothetical protein
MPDANTPAPPSFLATDDYVPGAFKDLLSEADGCLHQGFLTGGTACARRALDLLLSVAKAEGTKYEERLQWLREKHGVSNVLTSILAQCGDAGARDNATLSADVLKLFVVTLKAVVYELYVVGPERAQRVQYVSSLVNSIRKKPANERDRDRQPVFETATSDSHRSHPLPTAPSAEKAGRLTTSDVA